MSHGEGGLRDEPYCRRVGGFSSKELVSGGVSGAAPLGSSAYVMRKVSRSFIVGY